MVEVQGLSSISVPTVLETALKTIYLPTWVFDLKG
jgi:hypothetical protein